MLRILSVLLVLAGLLVAGLGGAALLEQHAPKTVAAMPPPSAASAPQAETAAAEPAPSEQPALEPAASEPEARGAAAPEGAVADPVAGVEAEAAEGDIGVMFQSQMEPAPQAAVSAAPAQPPAASTAASTAPPVSFADRLQTVPVAHETPRAAEYKRAFDVTFAIDATGDTTAADALPGHGVQESGEAKISEKVEVRLSGASFNIVGASPAVQAISPLTENTWRWSVTPLTAGDHDLVFEIYAMDSGDATPLRTFKDTVTVKVSGLNRAIAFADQANPLFVLLGGLGSALAGLFGAIKFFGKK